MSRRNPDNRRQFLAGKAGPNGHRGNLPAPRDAGQDRYDARRVLRRAGLGIETVITSVLSVDRITPLEVIGRDVIPAIADLSY
jgi:hypothetical protein